jgi:hypothetical protein
MPRIREYDFDISLPRPGHFVRVRFVTTDSDVTSFTVQYEIVVAGRTLPVVRYDSAHEQPHRDRLDPSGAVVEKSWLDLPNNEALGFAQADIKANWERYFEEFTGGRP